MLLGVATDSQDADGVVLAEKPVPALSADDIEGVFGKFRGDIQQIPPMVSAIKHKGQPLYKLARKGKTVEREPRLIHIYDLRLLALELPKVRFRVACTKGTYVRTLCADIGDVLGCGAHLSELRRARSGHFDVKDAQPLDKLLTLRREQLQPLVIPILELAKRL
jgi:tRNA pseudouridine55 synthase